MGVPGVGRILALQLMLLSLLATFRTCQAAITAWMTDIGPQLILQNTTTGAIMYSDCNSFDNPIYSWDPAKSFGLLYPPRNGTALAGVGWWSSNEFTVAAIWYQETEGRIANAIFNCDPDTGKFSSQGNWIVSDDAPSVHNETGLAALLLSSTAGYRVYYHDKNQAVNQLIFTNDVSWQWDRVISQSIPSSKAIHAVFHDTKNLNVSVAIPFDDSNFEITRWNTDKSWHVTTAPTPLIGDLTTETTNRTDIAINTTIQANFSMPAWSGNTKGIGITTDAERTRSIWYIGTDSKLHQVANIHYLWQLYPNQTSEYWPEADTPSGEIGVTSGVDTSQVHIFYFSDNNITHVKYVSGGWQAAETLATFNATAPTSKSKSSDSSNGNGSSLTNGAKVGVGVGVAVGVLSIGGLILALVVFGRRGSQRAEARRAAELEAVEKAAEIDTDQRVSHSDSGSQAGSRSGAGGSEMDAQGSSHGELDTSPMAMEMDSAPRRVYYELSHDTYSHELEGSTAPNSATSSPMVQQPPPLPHRPRPDLAGHSQQEQQHK